MHTFFAAHGDKVSSCERVVVAWRERVRACECGAVAWRGGAPTGHTPHRPARAAVDDGVVVVVVVDQNSIVPNAAKPSRKMRAKATRDGEIAVLGQLFGMRCRPVWDCGYVV
jgi:hypothetical protein